MYFSLFKLISDNTGSISDIFWYQGWFGCDPAMNGLRCWKLWRSWGGEEVLEAGHVTLSWQAESAVQGMYRVQCTPSQAPNIDLHTHLIPLKNLCVRASGWCWSVAAVKLWMMRSWSWMLVWKWGWLVVWPWAGGGPSVYSQAVIVCWSCWSHDTQI